MADKQQESRLAEAICELTCELRESRLDRVNKLATKADLAVLERNILNAIRSQHDAAIAAETKKLKASSDALEEAVNKNK